MAPEQTEFETESGRVTLECAGTGAVPVVLLAGGTDPVSTWDQLVDELGANVLTCRFDPIEPTEADPPQALITGSSRANALASALDSSGLPPPYVLVGHSLAGLTVRQFGADHGELLGGALLLDPTTPLALRSLAADLSGQGWDAQVAQAEADAEVTWPPVPLVVLAHDPALLTLGSAAVETLWTDGQRAYAMLSPAGSYEQVAGSGHYVYRDEPGLVVTTVGELIDGVEDQAE